MRKFDNEYVTCSAKLVDWVKMNQLAKKNIHKHYDYLGNFLSEEDNEAYALFNEVEETGENCYYCVKL